MAVCALWAMMGFAELNRGGWQEMGSGWRVLGSGVFGVAAACNENRHDQSHQTLDQHRTTRRRAPLWRGTASGASRPQCEYA